MPSGRWEWYAYDLRTEALLATIPMSDWSHESRLNDSGRWSATLAPPDSADFARTVIASTQETRTVILPMRDGQLVDGFTAWIPPGGNRRPELAGGDLWSYLDHRVLDLEFDIDGVDQFRLAAAVVDYVSGNGANIDTSQIGLAGSTWGTSDRHWVPSDRATAGDTLRELPVTLDPIDLDIRSELVVVNGRTVPRRVLRGWYPRRGHPVAVTRGPVFTLGRNLQAIPEIQGNPEFATAVGAVGAEIEQDEPVGTVVPQVRLLAKATSTDLLARGWPQVDHTVNLSNIDDVDTLQRFADGILVGQSRFEDDQMTLEVDPNDADWPVGSWDIGSDCRIIVPAGVDPWWPDGFNAERRIVAHQWEWSAANGERLQVVTGPVVVTV